MKFFMGSMLLIFSINSHAVVKRLTTLDCKSSDNKPAIEMKFDTSFSIYGPKLFKVLGQDTKNIIMGSVQNDTEYTGHLPDGKKFKFIVPDQKGRKNYEFKTKLSIDGVPSLVDCKVKTKMTPDISSTEVNDSERSTVKEAPAQNSGSLAPSASEQ